MNFATTNLVPVSIGLTPVAPVFSQQGRIWPDVSTGRCPTGHDSGGERHKDGKTAVLAAIRGLGIEGDGEVPGPTAADEKWKANVLFTQNGRTVAIELLRPYQHLREFIRLQERYLAGQTAGARPYHVAAGHQRHGITNRSDQKAELWVPVRGPRGRGFSLYS